MSRRLRLGIAATSLVGVVGAFVLVAYQLVGAGQGAQFPGDLLASNRTHLSLCVDRAGAIAGSGARAVFSALR